MSQRARAIGRFTAASCLLALSCTKLDDPNQYFGDQATAGTAGETVSAAGQGGDGIGATSPSFSGAFGKGGAGIGGAGLAAASAGGAAGSITIGAAAGSVGMAGGSGGMSCTDATGFHGLGCYRCAAGDIFTLENACTGATCTQFDDHTRLTLLGADGKLPPLPGTSAGGAATGGASNGGAGGTGAGGVAGAGGAAGVAGAAPLKPCADLAKNGTPVYITGSSAAKPFLQQIAQQLAVQNVYLVYTSTGSCVGVDAVVNGTRMTTGASPAPAASATYWESSSSPGVACALPPEGVSADIGASDVFAQSCATFELTSLDALQIRDAHGPIQTMTFAVPANSAFSEISAQAAYFVFGFGADGGVRDKSAASPIWNNVDYLFQRSATSGTQAMIAAAIGVPAAAWKGKTHKTSDDVAAEIQAAGQDQAKASLALGILAADYIDSRNLRAQVRVLAFQDSAQTCAVFPDSTGSAHDKKNVRDGHYPIWGPLHLLLKVDQSGNPLNPANRQAVADIVGYLSGTKALPNGVQLFDVYAQSGLIPECAMHVTRSKDGGNIVPFTPANPCSCLFELKATGTTSCTPCQVQGDCVAGQSCSQGYCER